MSPAHSQCPPADVIAAFALCELPPSSADSVRTHVSLCESCLAIVGHLAAGNDTASGSASPPEGALLEPGQHIGPYRLVRLLGEGGMGEVWEAQQLAPVKRTVALKVLKAGMDTRRIVARFDAERQVLALMQHPSIAQVFDAGVTPAGRSYFVMEYVDGIRITSYCDDAGLNLMERLLLFQQVCDAVQHAHQKGVIHRDIKPSNVLVTQLNGQPLPKVIDFGLAKLTAPDSPDASLTEVGTVLGTPAYASPEQMTFGIMDIDTRSDVYSLGVMLYELLTGVIPFDIQATQLNPLIDWPRQIREHEPTRPSARLSSLGARAAQIAQARGADTRALRRSLRGDLDWVVMKALEKHRARRYASAGELARDTQRFVQHQVVLARPPTPGYWLAKLVRRHRVATGFAGVLLLLIVAFAVVSAVQVKRIAAERDRATAEVAKASSINNFLQDTLGSADPWQTGSDISIRQALKQAADKVDTAFENQPLVAAAVRRTLGRTYIGLGRLDDAEKEIRAGLATRTRLLGHEHADVAESQGDLARVLRDRGDYEAAERASREALRLRRKLFGNQSREVADSLNDWSALLAAKGDLPAAAAAATEELTILEHLTGANSPQVAESAQQLGMWVAEMGQLARGEQLIRRGYDIDRAVFGDDDLRTTNGAANMGTAFLYEGRYAEAEQFYRIGMDGYLRHLGQNHPETVIAQENLANALVRLRRFDESAALMDKVLATRRAILGDGSRLVARTMINIATDQASAEHLDRALAAYQEAIPIFTQAYGPEHPDSIYCQYLYGRLLLQLHRNVEAERLLREVLAKQVQLFPDDHATLAATRLELGKALSELHQTEEAHTQLVRARDAFIQSYGADSREVKKANAALEHVN